MKSYNHLEYCKNKTITLRRKTYSCDLSLMIYDIKSHEFYQNS